jgi:hypothetical protein
MSLNIEQRETEHIIILDLHPLASQASLATLRESSGKLTPGNLNQSRLELLSLTGFVEHENAAPTNRAQAAC